MKNIHRYSKYSIVPTAKLNDLKIKIQKINDKLSQSGFPTLKLNEVDIGVTRVANGSISMMSPSTRIELVRDFSSSGEDFKLIAKTHVELKTEGTLTHQFYGDLSDEQIYAVDKPEEVCRCDHCHTNRIRVYMYSIETKNGVVRIGSGCLDKFAGFPVKSWMQAVEEAHEIIEKYCNLSYSDVKDYSVIDVDTFLSECVKTSKSYGIRSTGHDAQWSGASVFKTLQAYLDENNGVPPEYSDEIKIEVNEIKDLIRESQLSNDIQYRDLNINRRNIIDCGYVTNHQSPIMSSTVSWNHYNKLRIEKENLLSSECQNVGLNHCGDLGGKIIVKKAVVKSIWVSSGQWGDTTKLTMVSEDGNVFTWAASTNPELSVGDEINFSGTVKKDGHVKFFSKLFGKEILATEVMRCKKLTLEEIADLEAKNNKPKSKRKDKSVEACL